MLSERNALHILARTKGDDSQTSGLEHPPNFPEALQRIWPEVDRIDGEYTVEGRRSERKCSDISGLHAEASIRNLMPEVAFGFSDHFWREIHASDNSCSEVLRNERERGSSSEANLQNEVMRLKFHARERRFDDCHIHAVQQTTEKDRAEPSAWLTHLRCHEMLECHDLTPQVWEMLPASQLSTMRFS